MSICLQRREFIAGLSGAATSINGLLAAHAQQANRVRRVAALDIYTESETVAQERLQAFKIVLQGLGWTDGRNLRIDARFAANDPARLRPLAHDLAATSPDVILTSSHALSALREATTTIPIVYV